MEQGSQAKRGGSRGTAFYLLHLLPYGLNFVLRVGETFLFCI